MKNIKAGNMVIQILLFLQYITATPLSHEKCALENSDCLKTQAQATLHAFVQGVPELGIKRLDKLRLGDTNVKTADVSYHLRNTEIGGFNNTIIDDLSIHLPFKLMRLNFHTTLMANSDYKVDGSFFGLPVTGEGKCEISLKNLQMEMIFKFDIIKNEQGKDIMDIKNYFYGADVIDGAHTQLANLFNGDKEKSDAFHEMFNKFWRTIVANFGRYFTSDITKAIFEAVQTYMRSRPLEEFAQY